MCCLLSGPYSKAMQIKKTKAILCNLVISMGGGGGVADRGTSGQFEFPAYLSSLFTSNSTH